MYLNQEERKFEPKAEPEYFVALFWIVVMTRMYIKLYLAPNFHSLNLMFSLPIQLYLLSLSSLKTFWQQLVSNLNYAGYYCYVVLTHVDPVGVKDVGR